MAWTPQSWGQAWSMPPRTAHPSAPPSQFHNSGWQSPSSSWPSWQGWWQCKCGAWAEPAKKKCQRCGLKKAWATGAATEWTTFIQDGQICSAETAEARRNANAAAARMDAAEEMWSDMAEQNAQQMQEQKPQERIKEIDALLSSMNGDGATTRAMKQQLLEQKESAKREVTMSKPLPMQMETCRGAVDRASKRAEAATTEKEKAKDAYEKAVEFEEKMLNDFAMKKLEMQKLEHTVIERARSRPSSGVGSASNSLEKLRDTMSAVITDMEVGQVEPGTTSEAMALMEQLFNGLSAIATRPRTPQLPHPPVQTLPLDEAPRPGQSSVMQMLGATTSGLGFHSAMQTDPGGTMSPTAGEEAAQ